MSKTKEEILQRRYVTDKGFEHAERYIHNSMDEWGQQKVDEFKEKLKAKILSIPMTPVPEHRETQEIFMQAILKQIT